MAKFCGNCGVQLDDNAKVCGHCGTPLPGESTPVVKVADPKAKEKRSKLIKTVLAVAVVAVLAVVGINLAMKFTGYNALIRKTVDAIDKYDIDALVSMSSDALYYSDYDDYAESYFENQAGYLVDSFDNNVGHNYKLSYTVDDVYTLSGKKLNDFIEETERMFEDFDTDTIKKVVVAEITLTAKQGKKSRDKDIELCMTKEGSKWKIFAIR